MKINKEKTFEALEQHTKKPSILRVGTDADGKKYVECVKNSFLNKAASFFGIRNYNQKKILEVIQACSNDKKAISLAKTFRDKIQESDKSKKTIAKLEKIADSLFPFKKEVENASLDAFLRGSLPGYDNLTDKWKKEFETLDLSKCTNSNELLESVTKHVEQNEAIQDVGRAIQETIKTREGETVNTGLVTVKDASAFTTQAFMLRAVIPKVMSNPLLMKELNGLANHYNTRGAKPSANWTAEMEVLFDKLALALTGSKPQNPISQ